MDEITDSTGEKVPVSQVKRVDDRIDGKAKNSGLFGTDPDGPYSFPFETIDGREHSSQDYRTQAEAYAAMEGLKGSVEQFAKQGRSGQSTEVIVETGKPGRS
ncbi:MAG: hypothetical protein NTW96_26675 [Planctomycetia bacterium]|nr:hypothetical protein [Planctomycetia bacterium]